MIINNVNNKKGFTLTEIITTVAIIGTITALAVPNYLRIKLNTNMEMVRQQMRIVAEKMTEIINKNNQYPDPSEWPDRMNPGDPDEASLMGNLSAIDSLCYTTNRSDYIVGGGRMTYQFCSRPKSDSCGKWAGTKRFCVHSNPEMSQYSAPGVVMEMSLTSAVGEKMNADFNGFMTGRDVMDSLFKTGSKEAILGFFEYQARESLLIASITKYFCVDIKDDCGAEKENPELYDHPFSAVVAMNNDQLDQFNSYFDQAAKTMMDSGRFQLLKRTVSADQVEFYSDGSDSLFQSSAEYALSKQHPSQITLIEVGVRNPSHTNSLNESQFEVKRKEMQTANINAYDEWRDIYWYNNVLNS